MRLSPSSRRVTGMCMHLVTAGHTHTHAYTTWHANKSLGHLTSKARAHEVAPWLLGGLVWSLTPGLSKHNQLQLSNVLVGGGRRGGVGTACLKVCNNLCMFTMAISGWQMHNNSRWGEALQMTIAQTRCILSGDWSWAQTNIDHLQEDRVEGCSPPPPILSLSGNWA